MFPVERMNVHVCEWILMSAQPFSACLRILIINKMYLYVFWLMRTHGRRSNDQNQYLHSEIYVAILYDV